MAAISVLNSTNAANAAETPDKAPAGSREAVSGIITDSERHALPGASILIEDTKTGAMSGIDGRYTLLNLKPGTYTLRVSYVGFKPVVCRVKVEKDKVSTLDIEMKEGTTLQEVSVTGAFSNQRRALQMQKQAMGVTNVVSADQVGKFPDSNIGDALKRINGINVQYDQGEARFGQVRGTSADLTACPRLRVTPAMCSSTLFLPIWCKPSR